MSPQWKKPSRVQFVMSPPPHLYFFFLKTQFSDLYKSSPWSPYHVRSGITAFRYATPKQNLLVCCNGSCMPRTYMTAARWDPTSVCDSEGAEGLTVFYWSKFSAPDNVAMEIQTSSPERLQRRLPGSNKIQRESRNEQRYFMQQDDDILHLLGR